MATLILQPGKERAITQRHPWIFSGAVSGVRGFVGRGDVVDVTTATGEWLARGTWSAASQIRARLFTWDPAEPLDRDLLRRRIERALTARQQLPPALRAGDAQRLIFAESDGLPGLIVDRYGDYLVIQLLTQGMAARADLLIELLAEIAAPRGIYERSDAEVREKEGLPPSEGLRWGEALPERLVVQQHGVSYYVEPAAGQKTGFYLDQAINRVRVAAYCPGAEVLDCFSYSGGFSLHAARAGAASVTAIDTSSTALELVDANRTLNQLTTPITAVASDVFRQLREYRHTGQQFDVVILDPPKFAHAQNQLDRATRGYKDINLIAMQILRPGGILATFSCSGIVSPDLFQKVVFGAALDARRDVQVLERLTQAPDHPLLLTFPEGEYLKGLICRVL